MSYPKKKRINVAAANNHNFNLSHNVFTTHDFGTMKPIVCQYMVPGDSFRYKIQNITRLLSMPSPTYGNIQMKLRGFFVPCRSVLLGFNNMISNAPFQKMANDAVVVPFTTKTVYIVNYILSLGCTKVDDNRPTDIGSWDFQIESQIGTYTAGYYKFSNKARIIYDLFVSCGCPISFEDSSASVDINIMPILAVYKAYYDWIVPSRYLIQRSDHVIAYINSYPDGKVVSVGDLGMIFQEILNVYYENDLITSAWKEPFNPESYLTSTNITNPANINSGVSMNGTTDANINNNYPIGAHISVDGNTGTSNRNDYINAFTIESLGKLQDYLNRGMLAGNKIQDYLLTEFGMRPSSDALNLSTYLGVRKQDFHIGAVMANADTEAQGGVPLGAYGGAGFTEGIADFEYKTNEHGYLIITTELVPKTNPSQGLKAEFQMIDKLDFFQPEFDNMGVEALSMKDIFFKPKKINNNVALNPNKTFGYVPRYSKLKYHPDIISGDFANRFGETLKSWYLTRDLEQIAYTANQQFINENYCKVDNQFQNWDYIFTDTSKENDHFYELFIVNVECSRPMLPVEDALNPEHPNGTKDVTLNTNGNVE